MKVSIIGATSQIAKDLVLSFSASKHFSFVLFARNVALLNQWIVDKGLGNNCQTRGYSEFGTSEVFDVIINFVGVGDPKKAAKLGHDIFEITEKYDKMAVDYIKCHQSTRYIFLSSGAIYGGNYQKPVCERSIAKININSLKAVDYYSLAKLYAEIRHRQLPDLPIIDIRVFNYFSHRQDMSARFFITDAMRAIKNKEIFKTSSENIVRDYVTPIDFFGLVQSVLNYDLTNMALDCYTQSPVSKFDLLVELKRHFGLEYEIDESIKIINATGAKLNYYSHNRIAEKIGYKAKHSSMSGVIQEAYLVIDI